MRHNVSAEKTYMSVRDRKNHVEYPRSATISATKTTPLYTAHVYSALLVMTTAEYSQPTMRRGQGVGVRKATSAVLRGDVRLVITAPGGQRYVQPAHRFPKVSDAQLGVGSGRQLRVTVSHEGLGCLKIHAHPGQQCGVGGAKGMEVQPSAFGFRRNARRFQSGVPYPAHASAS